MFPDPAEIDDQTASTVVSAPLSCLNGFNDTRVSVNTRLLSYPTDPAGIVTANKSGIAVRPATAYPDNATHSALFGPSPPLPELAEGL